MCRFITYNRRGCARSSSPETGYDLVTQARDLAGVLDWIHAPDAHIIGSSAGGPISIFFAALYPARARSLILTGTAIDLFPVGEPGSDLVRQQLVILEREGAQAAFDKRPAGIEVAFNEIWNEPEANARGEGDAFRTRRAQWREQARAMPLEKRTHYYATELRSLEAYMRTTTKMFAMAVQAPTLVVHGTNDKMVSLADGQALAQIIPNAKLEIIQGGSHTLMARSEEARGHVIAWIQQREAGSARELEWS